ncbi:unnamed protein product [Discosporangium mesarthrocarpum]
MADCLCLVQLVPDCFYEVIARVARKMEPERYSLLFPLHPLPAALCGPGAGGTGVGDDGPATTSEDNDDGEGGNEVGGVSGSPLPMVVHPTHLFHMCLQGGRLTTAAWYLPLVRDDMAHEAALRCERCSATRDRGGACTSLAICTGCIGLERSEAL